MKALARHRRLWFSVLAFLACLLVFFVFWRLSVAPARQKAQSVKLNDVYTTATAPLAGGLVVEQSFATDEAFHAVGLVFTYQGTAPAGTLAVEVCSEAGQPLAFAQGQAAETLAGGYAVFQLGAPVHTEDGRYRLRVTADIPGGDAHAFSLMASDEDVPGWHRTENGRPARGSLAMLLAVDRIGSFLTGFYWAFALLAALVVGALVYLAQGHGAPLHRLYAVAAGCLLVLYGLILPPYSAPDEQFHINQTFNLSSQLMGQAPAAIPWGVNYRRASDTNPRVEDQSTTVFTYRELWQNLFTTAQGATPTVFDGEEVGGYRLIYLPAALAVTLCRLLGLGFVPTLYIGRLACMALFLWLSTLAVKLAPVGKAAFAAVCLLPMTQHLAASFSRDGLTIALYLLFTALCLRWALGQGRLDVPQYALLAGLAVLCAPAKVVYLPLLLLCFLIPAGRFAWRGRALGRWAARGVCAAVVALGAVSMLVQGGGAQLAEKSGAGAEAAVVSSAMAEDPALAAPAASTGEAEPPPAMTEAELDLQTFTLADVLRQPGRVAVMLARTLTENGTFYYTTMLGSHLGYFSLPLNGVFAIVFTLLLAAASLPAATAPALGRRNTLLGAGAVVLVAGLVVLGCLLWTPLRYTTIYGIQGRYFLPALPLALCLIPWRVLGVAKTRPLGQGLVACTATASILALLNAFLLVLER